MNLSLNPKFKKYLENFLLILVFIKIFFLTWQLLPNFQNKFDYFRVKEIYTHSQYNLANAEFYGNIEDDLLYQLAGYEYITGSDPSTINSEVPFLGKYIFGVSIQLFGSANVIQFLIGIVILILMFLLIKLLAIPKYISLSAILIFSFEPLFLDQLNRSLLDLPHAFFIILTTYLMSKYLLQKKYDLKNLIFIGLSLGAVASTKLWITGFIIWFIISCLIILKTKTRQKFLREIGVITLSSLVFYLMTHIVFFYYHPNPIEFVNLHVNTLRLYRSYLPNYPWGEFLRIIIWGKWQTWWGKNEIISIPEWTLFWPIGLITTTFVFIKSLINKRLSLILISVIILLYIISNLFHVVFPRYLLSVLPLVYVVMAISLWDMARRK